MLIALCHIGCHADASLDLLDLPDDMDLDQQKRDWREWYETKYRGHSREVKYINFEDWLKQHGAKDATPEQIRVIDYP